MLIFVSEIMPFDGNSKNLKFVFSFSTCEFKEYQ